MKPTTQQLKVQQLKGPEQFRRGSASDDGVTAASRRGWSMTYDVAGVCLGAVMTL